MVFCWSCCYSYFIGLKSRRIQYIAALGANLGLISIGMHFGWSSTALPLLTSGNYTFKMTNTAAAWLSSMTALGAIFGSILMLAVGPNTLGRRTNIFLCIPFLVSSWILIALATSETYMFVGSFLGGVMDGVYFTMVPPYLVEISDADIRGFIGTTIMVSMTLGMLAINLLNLFASMATVASVAAAVSLSILLIVPFVPESPYYLLTKNDTCGAERSLQKLRGRTEVAEELSRITMGVVDTRKEGSGVLDLFFSKQHRRSLVIVWGLNLVQHGSGSMAIQVYCESLFEDSGYIISPSTANLVYFGARFLATLVSPLVVDSAGRKPVLLLSSVVSTLALLGNGTYLFLRTTKNHDYIQLVCVVLFTIANSVGLQPIPSLVTNEIFPTELRCYVLCITNINFGLVSAATIQFFNAAMETFGLHIAFWGFGGLLLLGTIFIVLYVPETKKKTLESIQIEIKNLSGSEVKNSTILGPDGML